MIQTAARRQFQLSSRRYRQILMACLATLGISAVLLGTIVFMRWKAGSALRDDTQVVLSQAKDQLMRTLESRRGTLTLARDIIDRAPELNDNERVALAKSAVAHTRHLVGLGMLRSGGPLVWLTKPGRANDDEIASLDRAITRRTRLPNVWRVPSTFLVSTWTDRPILVMLEPLRAARNLRTVLVGVYDVNTMLSDFFTLSLQQPYPVQLLEDGTVLYRSSHWQPPSSQGHRQAMIQAVIRMDAIHWTLQMQPGTTPVVKTISSFGGMLIFFGVLTATALIGMIWLLAMRTWFLQRAVSRRTAALRRTTERLRQLATTDELTGLYNRRFFLERWQWEYERSKRYQRPLGCLMIDVNQFKRINDMLGHPAGDLLLKQVAQELQAHLRQSDIIARFGGDEFIVALPETSFAQASSVAEKLRELPIHGPWTDQKNLGPVRLSVGLSHMRSDPKSAQDIIQRADQDLYATRRAARRQPPEPEPVETTSSRPPARN